MSLFIYREVANTRRDIIGNGEDEDEEENEREQIWENYWTAQ